MDKKKVGVFAGSLRKESFSRKIAAVLKEVAPDSLELELVDLGALEMYNQDFDDEGNVPASWTEFRERVKKFDAVLFVTPEYNRSVTAVLKNALDVGSRPYGESVWDGKPGAVVSVSPGALSGFGANHHLRQALVFLNVPTMQQPEAYIGNVAALFDENGVMTNEKTKGFLKTIMDSFGVWVENNSASE
ncbi:NADPH-dependent FMN reductase [Anaerobium acetethylicum]|uniref:Chromate reductase n=1 Tax=Anaerobium acetethylicum TaxID=1619234 RepID=A0A1D3TRF8_9FIRM|nr:NAD(P)H-dependent oxidoreductase [Anaerobium acetethylicum]SCP96291.1 chromate reductase [Anaerobium acetethylicum]